MNDLSKWSNIASKYSRMIEDDPFREEFLYPLVLESLGDVKGKRILDAGCATGDFSRLLVQKGAEVIAVDASKEMLKIASSKTKSQNISYKLADLNQKLDFPNHYFDDIVAIHILMDVENLKNVLSEFFRLLKSNGKLVISISHPCFTLPTMQWKRKILKFVKVGDYFAKSKIDKFLVDNLPTTHYHRTIEEYIISLIEAGFVIDGLKEPKMPSDLAKKTNFFLADKIPMALIIKVKK